MRRHLPVRGADCLRSHLFDIVSPAQWKTLAHELHLTPRQAEIVYLVLQAKRDKEIADELGLGISTVRMHLRYVFNQLNISDRMELALLVFHRVWLKGDNASRQSK